MLKLKTLSHTNYSDLQNLQVCMNLAYRDIRMEKTVNKSMNQNKQHLANVIIFHSSKEQCHCLLLPQGTQ